MRYIPQHYDFRGEIRINQYFYLLIRQLTRGLMGDDMDDVRTTDDYNGRNQLQTKKITSIRELFTYADCSDVALNKRGYQVNIFLISQ